MACNTCTPSYLSYSFCSELLDADYYVTKLKKLQSTTGYLTVVFNFVSCLAMLLVLSLVKKVVK